MQYRDNPLLHFGFVNRDGGIRTRDPQPVQIRMMPHFGAPPSPPYSTGAPERRGPAMEEAGVTGPPEVWIAGQ